MEPEIWKTVGMTLGLLLGVPTVVLIIRVTLFVGSMKNTVESLGKSFDSLSDTLGAFATETRSTLGDHGERLAASETAIEGLERRERDRLRTGAYDRRGS